jgi:hypothetical protein
VKPGVCFAVKGISGGMEGGGIRRAAWSFMSHTQHIQSVHTNVEQLNIYSYLSSSHLSSAINDELSMNCHVA